MYNKYDEFTKLSLFHKKCMTTNLEYELLERIILEKDNECSLKIINTYI